MMIRRRVRDRLQELAGFLEWDTDPYLVITDAGRLVWMVDGYTTSDAHPYSRAVDVPRYGQRQLHPQRRQGHHGRLRRRNAPVHLRARRSHHRRLPAAVPRPVPARRRPCRPICGAHARYPETLFRVQAEIYRTYHMLDPQSFYNKEDLWDLARHTGGQRRGHRAGEPDLCDGHPARREPRPSSCCWCRSRRATRTT